jgi:hypothetical protein
MANITTAITVHSIVSVGIGELNQPRPTSLNAGFSSERERGD